MADRVHTVTGTNKAKGRAFPFGIEMLTPSLLNTNPILVLLAHTEAHAPAFTALQFVCVLGGGFSTFITKSKVLFMDTET